MKRLGGKSALAAGAARVIGKGFAEAHVREGAMVAIGDINMEAAEKATAEIGDGAYAVSLDVTRQDSIDAAVDGKFARLGGKKVGLRKAEVEAGVPAGRFATTDDFTGITVLLACAPGMITSLRGYAMSMAESG